MTIDLAAVIDALTDLGVLPVIALAAVMGIASLVYRRFRK
jgi:hypothetical protein